MTSTPTPPADDPRAPAAGAPPKPPWYRRRAVLAGGAIAILLAITVITDLPQSASRAQQVATERTVLKAVNADVHPCTFAVQQTFTLYQDEAKATVTTADRARIPRLMATDAAACSFSNATIFDLSTITVPGSAAGHDMGDVVGTVTLWATSDALAAIEQIQALSANPHDAKARAALQKEERLLASDRAKADAEVAAANRALGGATIPDPALPRLPDPGTTSGR